MQNKRQGPDFERSEKQRVIIGAYEAPTRPGPAGSRGPTLLQKLRSRITGRAPDVQRGPGFEQPEGVERVGRPRRARRNRPARQPSTRPSGFEGPTQPTAQ